MSRGAILLVAFASLLIAAVSMPAQRKKAVHKATLSGTVIGPDDKPVPRAAVTYQSSGGSSPHATHADAHGHFTIHNLRGDNYDVRASANGIFSEWEKNVNVRPGEQKTITLHLIYAKQMPVTGIPVKKKE